MVTEKIGFEAKVQGLLDYYRALEELDPQNPQHDPVANPDVFYWSGGYSASRSLVEARRSVLDDIACHGRREYGDRDFGSKDLREDTDELRAERADVLAVMTAPLTPELRQQRAGRIAGVLASIAAGNTIRLTEYDSFRRCYAEPVETAIDVGRALFGVFRNGYIRSRVLTVQYDTPAYSAPTPDVRLGEPVLSMDVPALFRGNGLRIETTRVV